jgi:hypothetical protein
VVLGIAAVAALLVSVAVGMTSSTSTLAKREALLVFCLSAAACFGVSREYTSFPFLIARFQAMTLQVHSRLVESGVPTEQLQVRLILVCIS